MNGGRKRGGLRGPTTPQKSAPSTHLKKVANEEGFFPSCLKPTSYSERRRNLFRRAKSEGSRPRLGQTDRRSCLRPVWERQYAPPTSAPPPPSVWDRSGTSERQARLKIGARLSSPRSLPLKKFSHFNANLLTLIKWSKFRMGGIC